MFTLFIEERGKLVMDFKFISQLFNLRIPDQLARVERNYGSFYVNGGQSVPS